MSKYHPDYDGLSTEFMDRLISAIWHADNGPGELGYHLINKVKIGSIELTIADGLAGEVWLSNEAKKESVALTESHSLRVLSALNNRSKELKQIAASKKHSFNELLNT